MPKPGAVASILLFLTYPIIIFFGLKLLEPRYVAALLAILLVIRWQQNMYSFISMLSKLHIAILLALLILASFTFIGNSEALLRIYPATMNLGMLLLFGFSLIRPPSIIELFARTSTPDLPFSAVAYTRKVTQIWCVFFIINGSIAAYTAFYTSRESWSFYNGLIAYIAMGVLFLGKWLVRRHFILQDSKGM